MEYNQIQIHAGGPNRASSVCRPGKNPCIEIATPEGTHILRAGHLQHERTEEEREQLIQQELSKQQEDIAEAQQIKEQDKEQEDRDSIAKNKRPRRTFPPRTSTQKSGLGNTRK